MSTDLARHGWIRRGLIWHNPSMVAERDVSDEPARPVAPIPARRPRKPSKHRTHRCLDCPTQIARRRLRCRGCWDADMIAHRKPEPTPIADEAELMGILERTLAADAPPSQWAGCCHCCGCLVLPDETCPGCLAWAERDAVRTSWRRPMEMAA